MQWVHPVSNCGEGHFATVEARRAAGKTVDRAVAPAGRTSALSACLLAPSMLALIICRRGVGARWMHLVDVSLVII